MAFAVQAPPLVHVPLVCQAPLALQVCVSVPQLPQATGSVCPGAHTPVQVPVPEPDTHVLLVHATALPHWPQALQVSTPLPEHCVAPGVHAGFAGHEQLPHAHVELHSSDPYVLHDCVAAFAHAPWLEHVPLVCQAPLALQVCVSVPQLPQATGFVWPGAQAPVQVPVPVPVTQVWLVQAATVEAHWPHALHVCTPLPEQRVAFGVHTGVDGHEQVPQPQLPQVCVP